MTQPRLFHDFETVSRVDLKAAGLSRYARDPSTKPLMLAWAIDDEPVQQVVFAEGQKAPPRLREALRDPQVLKSAWNAAFERAIFRHTLGLDIPIEQWRDTMVIAYTLSLPGSLAAAGEVVNLPQDKKKDARGKLLIRKFSCPRKPTNGKPWEFCTRETDPEEWEEYKLYNRQDVEAERAIWRRIRKWDLPEHEWALWHLDQRINEAGIPVNMRVVNNAVVVAEEVIAARLDRMRKITGLANPNSTAQLLPWLRDKGYPYGDLKKGHVTRAVEKLAGDAQDDAIAISFDGDPNADLREVLELRQEVSKSSVKKYNALQDATDDDGVLRGAFQFAAAGRTWRWGGRKYQPQNLARPVGYLEKMQIECVRDLEFLDTEAIELLYAKPMDLLSTCVRPVVQAKPGELLIDADLNAIENRVLGWMAGEEKILDVFRRKQDPYIDFARHLTGRTYDDLWHEYKVLHQKGNRTMAKPGVLGCLKGETPVLTQHGWKALVEITHGDLVFDGESFVSHDGVVFKGNQEVTGRSGLYATIDHRFLTPEGWKEWRLVSRQQTFKSALATVSGVSLNTEVRHEARGKSIYASADADSNGKSHAQTSPEGCRLSALDALRLTVAPTSGSGSAQVFSTYSQIVSMLRDRVAKTRSRVPTSITAVGEFVCGSVMPSTGSVSSSMNSARMERLKSIGSTTTATTSREIFDLQPGRSKTQIADTWDILNTGAYARFVVLTDDGCLVAHNCGYMLSAGEEFENEQTGEIEASGLLGYAWNMGVRSFTKELSSKSVTTWRETYTRAVEYWYEIERAARRCVLTGRPQEAGPVSFDRSGPFLRMRLPSGRYLHYCRPEVQEKMMPWGKKKEVITYEGLNDKNQWTRISTHPGKLTENADQAISRDLLAHGMMLAANEGLNIRLHVHDQIVCSVPETRADESLKVLQECMSSAPPWARDLPLSSEGFVSPVFLKD